MKNTNWARFVALIESKPVAAILPLTEIFASSGNNLSKNSIYHYLYLLKERGYIDNPRYGVYLKKQSIPLNLTQVSMEKSLKQPKLKTGWKAA